MVAAVFQRDEEAVFDAEIIRNFLQVAAMAFAHAAQNISDSFLRRRLLVIARIEGSVGVSVIL